MKKTYKIILLLLILLISTTYNPNKLQISENKKNFVFSIEKIIIKNNNLVNKDEVIRQLSDIYGKNILFIKRNDLELPLREINFLKSINVKKKYPNTIIITIYETKPVAILYKKSDKYLLDDASNLINFDENLIQKNLPSVFGEGGEKRFVNFYNQLNINKFPKQRIENYYYFRIDRWDIQLFNKQIIKFPSSNLNNTIQQSLELLNRDDFKNYNVIDLRIHGKIVVE